MTLDLPVKQHIEMLDHEIKVKEKEMLSLPEGPLHIGRNGPYYSWKWTDEEGNVHYIKKENESEASERALRKLDEALLHDLKAEREACMRYQRYKKRSIHAVSRLMERETPEFKRLLRNVIMLSDDRVIAWENQTYEKSRVHPEHLVHPTLKPDEKVRSGLEAMTAGCLTISKIPYLYEKILHINQWDIAADFTALDVRTFREVPIEVFGMMDVPEYRRAYERKMKTYIDGGYIPGVNMLVFYEFSDRPLSQADILEELQRFFYLRSPYLV